MAVAAIFFSLQMSYLSTLFDSTNKPMHFAIQIGGIRLNGAKVTAFRVTNLKSTMLSDLAYTLLSNMVKIGSTVQNLEWLRTFYVDVGMNR